MDPDENLKEQRELVKSIREELEEADLDHTVVHEARRLADLSEALDSWIVTGGFLPAAWAEKCHGGRLQRALLAAQVYDQIYEGTETLEGDLGMQIAYLLAAILRDGRVVFHLDIPEENAVRLILKRIFAKDHAVWRYISTDDPLAE